MPARRGPWEVGGEFHWAPARAARPEPVLPPGARLFSSGRGSLVTLLRWGAGSAGWRRLLLPDYYCSTVVDAVRAAGFAVAFYPDSPFRPAPAVPTVRDGDLCVVVNYFGLREARDLEAWADLPVPVVEDHSHDPWSSWAGGSRAAYQMASLRKTLPIPDGAALWSCTGAGLPQVPVASPPTAAAGSKTQAMLLKAAYLRGEVSDKEDFLDLFRTAEERFAEQGGAGMSPLARWILARFPVARWRRRRRANFGVLSRAVQGLPGVRLLGPSPAGGVAFSAVLWFDEAKAREATRRRLIQRQVYPAILWPFPQPAGAWPPPRARDEAARMLSLPCDGRYARRDMERVAAILREALR